MRRGYHGGILEIDGKFVGVNLGADFTAEHEWGIEDLQRTFGIPGKNSDKVGIERRQITIVPEDLLFYEVKKGTLLQYADCGWMREKRDVERVERAKYNIDRGELRPYGTENLATAWDGKSFGIYTTNKTIGSQLAQLHAAFVMKDAAIWLGGGGVFENAGLVVAIASKVPANRAKAMADADLDRANLLKRAAGTKIEETLKSAGKKWFALSPRWADKERDKTGYDVVFYLNPMEQNIYNSGCFTVEQLREWAQNKGPVMIEKKRAGRRR